MAKQNQRGNNPKDALPDVALPNKRADHSQTPLIRIAQIINRMDSGGIETVVQNYYRHIDRSKLQFDFYFAEGSRLSQCQELEQLGAGLYPIPPYLHLFAYHRALYAAFKQRGYMMVHAHLSTMSVFSLFAAWRAGVPVRICHNHSTACWGEGIKTLLKYVLRPFNKIFATDWFACGKVAGQWMYGSRAFHAGRVTVIPNAIDTIQFAYDSEARERLRGELGIPQNAFVVGHVGRFIYQKNHKFLLKAFAELQKTRSDAHLLLVGEGRLQKEIRRQAEAFGIQKKIIFTGARQDVNKLYSVMDVFCLPSHYEGMPVVAWEAQANGLPCLLSDVISREASQGPDCWFFPLQKGCRQWAQWLAKPSKRLAVCPPDIVASAARLEQFYLERSIQAKGET